MAIAAPAEVRGFKFRRQQPLGRYFVDFLYSDARLVVEVDGAQHYDEQRVYDEDEARDAWLRSQNFRVMRFSDREVLTELAALEQAIWVALLDTLHPPPRPGGREPDS